MKEPRFEITIGELAQRAGVRTSALRFYEDKGLIMSRRTSGNQRRYHRAMLRRVAFILAAGEVGIPLDTVASMLAGLGDTEAPTPKMWHAAASDWNKEIDERIAILRRMKERLNGCIGCGCLSFEVCTMVNPDDKLAAEGAGPRRLLHD